MNHEQTLGFSGSAAVWSVNQKHSDLNYRLDLSIN